MRPSSYWRETLFLAPLCLLTACGTLQRDRAPVGEVDLSTIPDAVPRMEKRASLGNPASYEVDGQRYYVLDSSLGYIERGTASWYGTKFHGKNTSSGEPYDMYAMTAAHRTLPLPTYARVTNLLNGRSVVVKINDRGPFHDNRLIDLSYVAAAKLDMLRSGTAPVEVRAIDPARVEPGEELAVHPVSVVPVRPDTGSKRSGGAPATRPKSGAENGRFYVQVGAFSQRRNAEMLRDAIASRGSTTQIRQTGDSGAGPLYRVWAGPFPSREKAQILKQQLTAAGISGLHIVTENE